MKIIDINGNNRDCVKLTPDLDWPGYMKAEVIDRSGTHSEWYLIDEFIKLNPNLKALVKGAPHEKEEDSGVVTVSKSNTLTDKKKVWENNIFSGTPVWISRGKGEGQTRMVLSNTKSTIVVNKDWDVLPDNTSQYLISPNVHDPKALGNTLSISKPPADKIKKERK